MYSRLRRDDGVALIAALMAMMLMLVLGTALMMMTITETRIAGSYREGIEVLYAADAGIELAVSGLRSVPDWSGVLSGVTTSTVAEGQPDGGPWRLYARGALADMLPGTSVNPRISVVVWVGADPSGAEGALILRAEAYGPQGARRVVEATIRREASIQRLSWRER
jgi:hypothetical protein